MITPKEIAIWLLLLMGLCLRWYWTVLPISRKRWDWSLLDRLDWFLIVGGTFVAATLFGSLFR